MYMKGLLHHARLNLHMVSSLRCASFSTSDLFPGSDTLSTDFERQLDLQNKSRDQRSHIGIVNPHVNRPLDPGHVHSHPIVETGIVQRLGIELMIVIHHLILDRPPPDLWPRLRLLGGSTYPGT